MPTIDIPSTLPASTTAQISAFFTSFSPMVVLALGLIGVSVVIGIILRSLHSHS